MANRRAAFVQSDLTKVLKPALFTEFGQSGCVRLKAL